MVFRHIWRGDKHTCFPKVLQLAYGACSCARHYEVGCCIGRCHIGDELCHYGPFKPFGCLGSAVAEILSGLPYHLDSALRKILYIGLHAFIEGAGSEASTHYKHCRTVGR